MTDNEEQGVWNWKWSSTGKISELRHVNYDYLYQTASENEEIFKTENCVFINAYLPDRLLDRSGPPFAADVELYPVNCSEELNIICEKE